MATAVLSPTQAPRTAVDVYADAPHSKSVMRQTQALIGLILLGGAAAAYGVSTLWLVVPLIIGGGLITAGLTGVCPMAALIARMPWNRTTRAKPGASSGGCCGGRCG